jgi:hypothetical protein
LTELQKMGRLALRVEGNLWCAYYALPDTMEGALFLGSIRKVFVEDAERKLVFMELMKEAARRGQFVVRLLCIARHEHQRHEHKLTFRIFHKHLTERY